MLTRTIAAAPPEAAAEAGRTGEGLTISGVLVPWDSPIEYGGVSERFARGSVAPDAVIGMPLLWAHDRAEPIGRFTDARDAESGLEFTAEIVPTSRGRDAIALLRAEAIGGMSIGFDPVEVQQDGAGGITYLRAAPVEGSVTPLPAYGEAAVLAVRQVEDPATGATNEREAADMADTETRDATVDLTTITERLDAIEARASESGRTDRARTVSVRDAFAAGILDYARTGQRRALADVVSSGNAGILPPEWDRSVLSVLDTRRPLIGASGSTGFPSTGVTKTFPKVLTHTTVGARGTEKTQVPSSALTTGSDVYTAQWLAGAVDVAIELIAQSDPSVALLVASDLLAQYAIASETAHATSTEAAATATGAALRTDTYGNLIDDIIGSGVAIEDATGAFGDMLAVTAAQWAEILGLLDGDGRRVFAGTGASNADGSASLTASAVNIGGVTVFRSPRSTEAVQFNSTSLLVAEKPPMSLTSVNVPLAGQDYGILGAIMPVPRIPDGILKYDAPVAGAGAKK